jgi:hypothetical protein
VFLVLLKLFAFLSKRPMVGNCVAPSRFRRQCAEPCRTAASMRSSSDKGNIGFGGHRVGDRVAVGGEHAAFERRAILATSPHQPYAAKIGSRARSERALGAAFDKGGAASSSGESDANLTSSIHVGADARSRPLPLRRMLRSPTTPWKVGELWDG